MCGIIAAFLAAQNVNVRPELYEGLGLLQHRGQDAAGIVTNTPQGRLFQCKGNGMVRDVFQETQLVRLEGNAGVGHVRYPTAGSSSISEAQPFYVNSPYGIVMAHNGNLTNTKELRDILDLTAHRHINTDSDSEVLLNIFADELNQSGKSRVNEEDVFRAIKETLESCRGGIAVTGLIAGYGIFAFRDPHGIRPLVFGRRLLESGEYDYMFASESVVLDVLGYNDHVRDVHPGEGILVTKKGIFAQQCLQPRSLTPCIFEYVYFARPDSIMNGISVYKSRLAMGEALAKQILHHFENKLDIDVVIPVPDTSRVAALQVSECLKIIYREGFIKNRYVGRTFIMPGQNERQKSVRRKLHTMPMEFSGKNVLLVDDSVVRGTTSKEIVQMARDCGAKKVYFASCAPAIRFPNVYGIDMPTRHELVAYGKTEAEVAAYIGADKLIYQDLQDLIEACRKFNTSIPAFDVSVFNGSYITNDISESYLQELESHRSSKKPKSGHVSHGADTATMGLHNNYYRK